MELTFIRNGRSETREALLRWHRENGRPVRQGRQEETDELLDMALERVDELRLPLRDRICIIRKTV